MSNDTDRTIYGEWDAEQWHRNEPDLSRVSPKDWGEYTSQDWQRGEKATQDQQQPQERKP